MIVVTATMTVDPEHTEAFLAAASRVIESTLADEPGCHAYACSRAITDPTRFVFVEEWEDMAAIGAHVQSPHYAAFKEVGDVVLRDQAVKLHTVEKTRVL